MSPALWQSSSRAFREFCGARGTHGVPAARWRQHGNLAGSLDIPTGRADHEVGREGNGRGSTRSPPCPQDDAGELGGSDRRVELSAPERTTEASGHQGQRHWPSGSPQHLSESSDLVRDPAHPECCYIYGWQDRPQSRLCSDCGEWVLRTSPLKRLRFLRLRKTDEPHSGFRRCIGHRAPFKQRRCRQ